ncbi:MAG TPA: hypothetical protein VGK17_19940 [Propionicimonas sp.]|jgi:hypothetical protein
MFPILDTTAITEGTALPAFVVASNGLYLRKRSLLGVSQTRVGRIAHLPAGSEFVEYALPRVPADLMARVVGFFRAVYRLHRTEAAVLLVWRDGVFDLVVPAQRVTSVSVSFDVRDGDVPPGWRVVGSMHSHGAYGAYASTTDEDDEAELDGLHVVVGEIDKHRPGYAAAVVVDGVRFELKASRLFERPRRFVEPPEAWLGKVTVAPAPRRPKTKPSTVQWTGRGFRPSDEIARPSKAELDAAIAKASRIAASLGYRLSHWLVPAEVPAPGEEAQDAG